MSVLITQGMVRGILPPRDKRAHKGDFGRVLIIAGSEGMMGAAVLSARAALRSGAGLVSVACETEFFPIVHMGCPEATCRDRCFCSEELHRYDAIGIGPGLGVSEKTTALLKKVLESYDGPIIIDADALNTLAAHKNQFKKLTSHGIMTPHEGEAAKLLNSTAKEISENRESAAKIIAKEFSAVCVLKGGGTLVASSEGDLIQNTTGNPGMATGGSGDVLTGMLASFAAQLGKNSKQQNFNAANAAVYIHGLAGDLAKKELGEYGLIAADIVHYIPYAIKETMIEVGSK